MSEKSRKYDELTFSSNFLFCKILSSNKELCKELIRIITGRKVRDIVDPRAEAVFKETIGGKGIRLDVIFADDENTVYDIEMQTTSEKNLPKRARYYQSMLDTSALDENVDYIHLPQSLVIFICTFAPFKADRHIYTFENRCLEDGSISLGDETRKVFLSTEGAAKDVTEEMRCFLDFVAGRSVEGAFAKSLQEEVQKAHQNEEWRREYMQNMAAYMDAKREGRAEGIAEGVAKGIAEGSLRKLYELVAEGLLTIDVAAKNAGMSKEQFSNGMILTGFKAP